MPPRLHTTLRMLLLSHRPSLRSFNSKRTLINGGDVSTDSDAASPNIRQFESSKPDDDRSRARSVMDVLTSRLPHSPSAATSTTVNSSSPAASTEEFTQQELNNSQFRFQPGDVYAPNDLTMEELRARRSNRRPVKDAFDVLGINPITQYKNYNLLSDYVTSMGRIMHSRETGLRLVNQRRIAKAIRRAVGIGFLPSTHRHPEILKNIEINMNNKLGKPLRR